MKNNKILITIILLTFILCLLLCACNNFTEETSMDILKYAVIESGGHYIIHEIDWSAPGYCSIRIKTKCCGNVIEATNAVLYKEMPDLNGITKCWEEE